MSALRKDLGFFTTLCVVVGMVIGSGVFVKPATVLMQVQSIELSLLAWLVGGLITLASGLTIAEVAARVPKTGGVYAYLREIYGERLAFTAAWVFTLIYAPGLMGALALYFSYLLTGFFLMDSKYIPVIALLALVFLTTVNVLGTKYGGLVQRLSTIIKFIPIVMIGAFGIFYGDIQQNVIQTFGTSRAIGLGSFGVAVLATFWAYDGWILVGNVAGEVKDAAKNLPKAIVIGLLIVIAVYMIINIAIFALLPMEEILKNTSNVSLFAAQVLFGDIGGKVISIGIIISIFGCLNGSILSSPRILYAMASSGKYPSLQFLTKVQAKTASPARAIFLQMAITVLMVLVAKPDALTDLAMFSVYGFYVLVMIGLFLLRKKTVSYSGYRTPLFPVIPLLAIVSTLFVLGSVVIEKPILTSLSFTSCVVGYFMYLLLADKKLTDKNS